MVAAIGPQPYETNFHTIRTQVRTLQLKFS